MVNRATALNTALNLMERALELLDDAGASAPGVHLQMAIDVMTNAPIPRTIEEADAMLDTDEARALMARLARSRPNAEETDYTPPPTSPEAIQRAAELVQLYGDKALGRTRMQLYEALGRRETDEVDHLAQVCSVLMQGALH